VVEELGFVEQGNLTEEQMDEALVVLGMTRPLRSFPRPWSGVILSSPA